MNTTLRAVEQFMEMYKGGVRASAFCHFPIGVPRLSFVWLTMLAHSVSYLRSVDDVLRAHLKSMHSEVVLFNERH